ncbi:MAG: hypothetical protein EBS42_07950, partial [Caulobacteraceae bacterium]|nr:hypothetical protein [Caulobacteraceae bacterium]
MAGLVHQAVAAVHVVRNGQGLDAPCPPPIHGLPEVFRVLGFDINPVRVRELQAGHDRTLELTPEQLRRHPIEFTTDPSAIARSRFIVVTVPTPIDAHHRPDLTPLVKASTLIGRHLEAGTVVVFESTVYPGCTEEDCIPV